MTRREYASVVVAALLVIASGGATYAGGGVQPSATAGSEPGATGAVIDELLAQFGVGGEADAVYVDRTGDAVFRYENDHDVAAAVPIEGELGVEAGSGLAHALYAGDLERVTLHGREATGNATMRATPASVTGTGEILVDDRGDVESFSADVRRIRTDETASSSLELAATVANETRLYGSVETTGHLETTATTISASGTMRTTVPDGSNRTESDGPIALDERRELTVTETDGTVRLRVSETRTVGEWERDRWATEADARASLENRYDERAILLGGEAAFTLESYAFDDGGDRETVELEYTVAFTDVKEGLAERITRELRATTNVDLDEHEARVIADRLATVSIEEVSVAVVQRGLETDVEWNAEFRDADRLLLGFAEVAGSNDRLADAWADGYDAARTDLEAQRAAALVRRTAWTASIDHDPATGRTTVDAVAESDAENWRQYAAERENRGLGPIPARTATLTGTQVDDGLELRYEFVTDRDGTGTATFERLLRVVDGDLAPTIDVAVAPLTDAAFEVARVDATVDGGTVEIESAAAFDDAATPESGAEPADAAIHAVTERDRTSVFVTTAGAFGSDPTDDEIRDHPRVGPTTSVHGPGEWDREFPSIDAGAARAFLEEDDDSGDRERDGSAPVGPVLIGGGVFAALVAGTLLWLPWRRVTGRRRDRPS